MSKGRAAPFEDCRSLHRAARRSFRGLARLKQPLEAYMHRSRLRRPEAPSSELAEGAKKRLGWLEA